jgi:hypothetical protein
MLPDYDVNRAAILFFAPFLLVGNLFLLNLVLAVVVKVSSHLQPPHLQPHTPTSNPNLPTPTPC